MNKHKPTRLLRFPRRAGSAEDQLNSERDALVTEARFVIADFRKLKVRFGGICLRIKATLKHGEWGPFFQETFGYSKISFRSAERYMALARNADADAKSDSLTVLKAGKGAAAREIEVATEEVQGEGGVAPKPDPVYRLALHLSPEQRDATIRLWKSPRRRRAEREIVAVLDRLLVKFGLLKREGTGNDKETT
jgi:hypothetical protein